MERVKILIVEDDPAISDLIALNLEVAGYDRAQAFDSRTALLALEETRFDLVLLDIRIPGIDGLELVRLIRPSGIPVIFLTARNGLMDRVNGLKAGADDYIVKPFEAVELLARIEAVLRRSSGGREEAYRLDDVEIQLTERVVLKANKPVELTPKEYELLLLLIRNKNRALTREKILEVVWNFDYMGESRTVDMHIQKLRKKLEWTDKIKTVYKYGYRLEEDG
ncbi:response regulator transcription factor [Paenibacillus aurantius]|uniref:Response regulator transcription factor n=1 Tax=Paenibacillus aurantius TaxID=2918900 RepID=A0AA96RG28_9BACL|nr:response regulator transcription factor [Paenibacillus aurantius]WNQ12101.1 response regulator transcription factor [Paenibacillus aurantius]